MTKRYSNTGIKNYICLLTYNYTNFSRKNIRIVKKNEKKQNCNHFHKCINDFCLLSFHFKLGIYNFSYNTNRHHRRLFLESEQSSWSTWKWRQLEEGKIATHTPTPTESMFGFTKKADVSHWNAHWRDKTTTHPWILTFRTQMWKARF